MPRISTAGASNARALLDKTQAELREIIHKLGIGKDEEPSPGISSSTSGDKPVTSGDSALETDPSRPSPAPETDSPSNQPPPTSAGRKRSRASSSATTAAGSTPGTTPTPQSQPISSAGDTPTSGPGEEDPGAGGFLVKGT